MKIPTVKHTLVTPVDRLEKQIPFKFAFIVQLRKLNPREKKHLLPKFRWKACGRICSPSLMIPGQFRDLLVEAKSR